MVGVLLLPGKAHITDTYMDDYGYDLRLREGGTAFYFG